jgi:hypothetical protein
MVNLNPFGLDPSKFLTLSNNTYRLHNLEGNVVFSGPINGHLLKLFFV